MTNQQNGGCISDCIYKANKSKMASIDVPAKTCKVLGCDFESLKRCRGSGVIMKNNMRNVPNYTQLIEMTFVALKELGGLEKNNEINNME